MPAGIGLGIVIGILIMILGAAVTAWMVTNEIIGQDAVGYSCMLIHVLSSLVGSIISFGLIRHRRLMVSGAVCAGYYLVLLVVALAFGGIFTGMGTTALMVVLGGGIAQIPALIGSSSGARRHKIPAYR